MAQEKPQFITMKHNHHHNVGKIAGRQTIPVSFAHNDPTAHEVCVAGTFNNWQPGATALHRSKGGRWFKETVLRPGTYEYCLVVDGLWMPDPLASESVPNPFGGRNSVRRVLGSPVTEDFTETALSSLNNKIQEKV